MDLIDLLDNIIVWYGSKITPQVYREYLATYISIQRPTYLPSIIHNIFNARGLKEGFDQGLRINNILVLEELVER